MKKCLNEIHKCLILTFSKIHHVIFSPNFYTATPSPQKSFARIGSNENSWVTIGCSTNKLLIYAIIYFTNSWK